MLVIEAVFMLLFLCMIPLTTFLLREQSIGGDSIIRLSLSRMQMSDAVLFPLMTSIPSLSVSLRVWSVVNESFNSDNALAVK